MLFGKKKKAAEKPEILKKENIIIGCEPAPQEDIIRRVGQMLVDSGYVDSEYVEGMIKREQTFSTNIGNAIALPHGVDECKANVIHSGVAVMTFPQGTQWGDAPAKIVIGVAGVGDDHLDILANVAEHLALPEDVERIVSEGDAEAIYQMFTGLTLS